MISLVGSGSGLLDEGRFGSQKTGSSWLVDSRCIGEGAMELEYSSCDAAMSTTVR